MPIFNAVHEDSFIPCCPINVADNSEREEAGFDRPSSSSSEVSEEDEDLDSSGDNLNNIVSKLNTAGKGLFVNGQGRAPKKLNSTARFLRFWMGLPR